LGEGQKRASRGEEMSNGGAGWQWNTSFLWSIGRCRGSRRMERLMMQGLYKALKLWEGNQKRRLGVVSTSNTGILIEGERNTGRERTPGCIQAVARREIRGRH